jgi:flagellar protein FlaJ
MRIFKGIARRIPNLKIKLKQGGMNISPEKFIKKTFLSAIYFTFGLLFVLGAFMFRTDIFIPVMVLATPVIFFFMFSYFLRLPDVKARKVNSEINTEIVDAGRFLLVELESGVSLYDSLKGIVNNFKYTGKYFKKIVVSVDHGTSIEEAITHVLEYTPSKDFRRILWQIINSLKTGADVSEGLKGVVEQISQEHLISVRRYGRKLNPLSMFYMIIAVIVPSLGITMLVVFSSLLSIQIDFAILMTIALILVFVQYLFLAIVKSSRPAINM